MSNRKKAKKPWLNRERTRVNGIGMARTMEPEPYLEMWNSPEKDAEVIKEVPAVVTHPETEEKVEVGTAYIHDDGSVAIKYDENAPQWALDYIKSTSQEVGYSLGPMFPDKED